MENVFEWLQRIYEEDFCDGSWEHEHGMTISNIDNPGWDFRFDLVDTDLEGMGFEKVNIEKAEKDWIQCWKEGGIFYGCGGARNLTEILEIFREWYNKTTQFLDEKE